jgi:hypothetical protein
MNKLQAQRAALPTCALSGRPYLSCQAIGKAIVVFASIPNLTSKMLTVRKFITLMRLQPAPHIGLNLG